MNTSIKRLTNALASRFGYHIVPEWRAQGWPLSRHLQQLFKILEVNCVLDVGANEGQYHDFLRDEVGYSGLIISFEPIKGLADRLLERAKSESNWEVVGHALGSAPGTLHFNVMSDSKFSSFLQPNHRQVGRFTNENRVVRIEAVQIETLDKVINETFEGLPNRHLYLKLDTQGSDLDVLLGAQTILHRLRGLQTEASVRPIYAGMSNHKESLAALEAYGFDLSAMFPVSKDRAQRLIEYDMILVNRSWADDVCGNAFVNR